MNGSIRRVYRFCPHRSLPVFFLILPINNSMAVVLVRLLTSTLSLVFQHAFTYRATTINYLEDTVVFKWPEDVFKCTDHIGNKKYPQLHSNIITSLSTHSFSSGSLQFARSSFLLLRCDLYLSVWEPKILCHTGNMLGIPYHRVVITLWNFNRVVLFFILLRQCATCASPLLLRLHG